MPNGSGNSMALKPKQKQRKWLFCGKCGRIGFTDQPELEWWLVGSVYGNPDVVRCPQHITTWTLRISGRGRSKANYRWARMAKMNDTYDPATAHLQPIMVEEGMMY